MSKIGQAITALQRVGIIVNYTIITHKKYTLVWKKFSLPIWYLYIIIAFDINAASYINIGYKKKKTTNKYII